MNRMQFFVSMIIGFVYIKIFSRNKYTLKHQQFFVT